MFSSESQAYYMRDGIIGEQFIAKVHEFPSGEGWPPCRPKLDFSCSLPNKNKFRRPAHNGLTNYESNRFRLRSER
jgi:hypothetical protein